MDAAGFKRGADHAVEPGESCIFGVVDDHFLKGAVDADLFLHALLAGGGELRDGDEERARTVRAGEPLKRGAHHGARTRGVEVDHVHIEGGEHGHRFFHGVGDIVQLEIEEDLMAARLDLAHDGRAFSVEELHADLHKGLFAGEAVKKCEGLFLAVKIQCDDNVLTHGGHLL